ncbi:MAG: hypothetical protein GEU78_05525 [Actinobacteria bacterium]|nr:hypothetical protein [Actinomycetota bacterium]
MNLITLADDAPAGGAATEELIPATIVALVIVSAIAAFGVAHRSGKTRALVRVGEFTGRVLDMPPWAALPSAIARVSLVVAAFGFYADVASHIDKGRDPGPFANPFHYFIIIGLAGIALAGVVAILLGSEETSSSFRIRPGWHAPVGGILLLVCGGIAVMGFPLDDVWHRFFGQDVTLWSPTHMQMVGGAVLSTLALWILLVEGRRAQGRETDGTSSSMAEWLAAGALLIGLSAFQAEFDYSVPQFRLLYHPILLMLSAGSALVLARIRLGRGGALKAVGLFLVLRGVLSIIVGPVLGHTALHFPLYLVEALAVEVVAFRFSTQRQLRFGIVAGVAIGTFGLAAEWAWSHVWMTMEWPRALLPEAFILGLAAAVSGGVLGGLVGRAFVPTTSERERVPLIAGIATGVAILFVLAYPFPTSRTDDASASVALVPAGEDGRYVDATITLHPPDLADGAEWFNVTSWQGGGSVVDQPEEMEPGTYRTSTPIPAHGDWKALIRLHRSDAIAAVPIYLPEDSAIPAPEVAAEARFTRPFVVDKSILLREAKDVSGSLTYGASAVMCMIAVVWAFALGWGVHRLQRVRR